MPIALCRIALIAAALAMPPAYAQLCKYTDEAGHITYSDSPVKGARKLSCIEAPPPPPPPPAAKVAPRPDAKAVAPAAGGLPNVDAGTQRRRDDTRRKILADELAAEQRALEVARKALSDGEAVRLGSERNYQRYLDRIQGLRDRVVQHERNVNALRTELSNFR